MSNDKYENIGKCCFVAFLVVCATFTLIAKMGEVVKEDGAWSLLKAIAYPTAFIAFIVLIILYIRARKELEHTHQGLYNEQLKTSELTKSLNASNNKISKLEMLLKTHIPFSLVAKMYADAHNIIFDEDIKLMLRRHNHENTIQLNKQRKEDYNNLYTKYQILQYEYSTLVSKYFYEIRSQLQTEDLFLQFLNTYTTKQYIELLNERIKQYNKERNAAIVKYDQIHTLLQSATPFRSSAELIAKIDSAVYDKAAFELRYKQNPAYTTADKIESELKQEYIKWRKLYEELYAKYQFLCETFPDLKLYVDDEKSLLKLSELNSVSDLQESTDKGANYLSREEWLQLTQTQRNQLALDRYIKSNKDNSTIGWEYEMSVDYYLRTAGFTTIPHGILHGLHDLGRDIIAWKEKDGVMLSSIYVIQCKLRSRGSFIHENTICQVYGTAIAYELENPNTQVIPTICTNVPLSETAQKFATKLHIFCLFVPMQEFPRIKCNINNGEKIYHLPFDQQYWHTQIKNDGEFYAWTVEDAERKGFRRAMRHNPYTN